MANSSGSGGRSFNRELSWIEFNQRVLDEAFDPSAPLLERVKFFCITSSNLDEFFEVRVAGLKQQIESGVTDRSPDGMAPSAVLKAVQRRVRCLVGQQYRCWRDVLCPELEASGIRFLRFEEMDPDDVAWLQHYYTTQVLPVLTPLAIDPAHPFPQLLNKSLNVMVQLEIEQEGKTVPHLAVVQVPRVLPRLVKLPREDGRQDYVFLAHLISQNLGDLFPGTRILGSWNFRVTRNSELYIDEEEAANLLKAVENELHNRRKGDAVRLELEIDCPFELRRTLLKTLRLDEDDLYMIDGLVNPIRLMAITEGDHSPELRDTPFVAPPAASLADDPDIFEAIRRQDHLLHHPYEPFQSVVDFVSHAARDPRVLAIKQTLYRTGGDSRIVGALMEAVRNGKQVTAVVELRARFDEANNILWARTLEEAGVHVVYGLVGYKIHSKMCLVVRRDDDDIRRYVHLGTGNYNPSTAKLYTDLSLFTCDPEFGEDVTSIFNLLTGICQFQETRQILVSPFQVKRRLISMIEREAENARVGLPARIIAKMNALVDIETIEALYLASQAGVEIDLIVRGICCLRPGVRGLSEHIRVRSIVDRFLEHSRITYFENGSRPEVYVGSADWMPRNFHRRIETVFPIRDGRLRDRIIQEVLQLQLEDNTKARVLHPDGSYTKLSPPEGEPSRRSQQEFIDRVLPPPPRTVKGRAVTTPKMRLRPRPTELDPPLPKPTPARSSPTQQRKPKRPGPARPQPARRRPR